ncbi:hypothetical protein JTB14_011283 [Gonioctena quinquepunctata]|nr:hypothetical protein JTB14_011283 [Gonioctena quinquepunctata]
MIQDMHSPEYYLEKVEVVNQNTNEKLCRTSKYCDIVANETECIDFDSEKNVPAERQTYVVISVPGVNNWAQGIEENDFKIDFNKHLSGTGSKKRSHEQSMDVEECPIPDTSHNIGSKKICNGNSSGSDNHSAASVRDLSSTFPIPNKSNKICHLKVYKDQEGLKLNEVYEFIGFLATDAVMDPVLNKDDENSMEFNTLHPPTSLVPRIHCVSYTKLVNQNPLLRNETDPADSVKLDVIRKELLVLLKQLLLGDDLAAEYLLLHLISEVYARRNFLPLGKFSLNISNIPGLDNLDFVGELYKFIEKLVHKSFYLPMTLENLNDLSFIPKKDYESNSLISGILQLSGNTHVVLDETKLSPGKLNAAGINNVKAIARLLKTRR